MYFSHCWNLDGTSLMPVANKEFGQAHSGQQKLAIQSTNPLHETN
jgi:hypothetical protein